jgi:hypothetical protein
MAGRPGRSGGHNRISVEDHIMRGTYNPTRHGHRAVLRFRATKLPASRAPAFEGLTGLGAAFVEGIYRDYEGWNSAGMVLLRMAGQLVSDLEELRGKPGERAAQKMLLSVLGALDLRAAAPAPAVTPDRWPSGCVPQFIK